MNKEIINKIIKAAKANNVNFDLNEQNLNKNLKELGLDSLSTIGIIVNIENDLDIRIPDESLNKIKTANDLIKLIEECLAAKK